MKMWKLFLPWIQNLSIQFWNILSSLHVNLFFHARSVQSWCWKGGKTATNMMYLVVYRAPERSIFEIQCMIELFMSFLLHFFTYMTMRIYINIVNIVLVFYVVYSFPDEVIMVLCMIKLNEWKHVSIIILTLFMFWKV